MKTTLLVGPSIELPRARRKAWVRKRIRGARPALLIGVDGGTEFLTPADHPRLVIGDWDSGSAAVARRLARAGTPGTKMVTLPRSKDHSDLYFALETLSVGPGPRGPTRDLKEARRLLLIGFTGGRPDHLLAGLWEIGRFAAKQARGRGRAPLYQKIAAIGPEAEYHFLTPRLLPLELSRRAPGAARAPVSVFAWGGTARGITMTGFEYGMKNGVLEPSSRGLSNRIRARRAEIRVRKGILLVVIPRG